MAGSKLRVFVVCHLRDNSWLSLPQGIQGPNRLYGGFFFVVFVVFFCKRPYTLPHSPPPPPHPTHPTEYWQQTDFIHDTRHLCTPIRIDEIKAMSRGFSGDKQVKTIFKCKTLRSSMFILDNRN